MKKILLCIVALIALLITIRVESLDETISVSEVNILDKSTDITADEPALSNNQIDSSIKFNKVDDYIIYEFTIDNKETYDYVIDKVTDNNTNTNLSIEYDYEEKISKKDKGTLKVKLTYKNALTGATKINVDDLQIKISLTRSDGTSNQIDLNPNNSDSTSNQVDVNSNSTIKKIDKNPNTSDSIINYIVLFVLSLIIITLVVYKYKTSKLLFILPLFIIPFSVNALEKKEIIIKFTNIEIKGIRETNLDGTPVCTEDEYLYTPNVHYVISDVEACKEWATTFGFTAEGANVYCNGGDPYDIGLTLIDFILEGYLQYDDVSSFISKTNQDSWCRPKSEQCFDIIDNGDGTATIDNYACGAEYDEDTSTYNTEGKTLNVTIPSKVTGKDDELTVTTILKNSFSKRKLASVSIPSSVKIIEDNAFVDNEITNLSLSNGLLEIGNNAFENNQITLLTVPNTVTSVGTFAFNNNKITSLTISTNLTKINNYAFSRNLITNVIIPDSVTLIDIGGFYSNKLESVTIGSGVITIGMGAFMSNELTSLVIPNNVVEIENYAFKENKLESLTIGSGVRVIGSEAFAHNLLTSDELPSTVTTVGNNVFANNPLDGHQQEI